MREMEKSYTTAIIARNMFLEAPYYNNFPTNML
jgi:hypothetical protein